MKWLLVPLIAQSLPVVAGQAELNRDCMAHAQAFTYISNNAVSIYPNRKLSEEILMRVTPKTTPPEAGINFAKGVIDRVYNDKSFRRFIRDAGQVDFTMSYYRNCLEEPENYLSDYGNVK